MYGLIYDNQNFSLLLSVFSVPDYNCALPHTICLDLAKRKKSLLKIHSLPPVFHQAHVDIKHKIYKVENIHQVNYARKEENSGDLSNILRISYVN